MRRTPIRAWSTRGKCEDCERRFDRDAPWIVLCEACAEARVDRVVARVTLANAGTEVRRAIGRADVGGEVVSAPKGPSKLGGLPAPTKAEDAYHDRLREMGCACCWLVYGHAHTPCSIHHVLEPGSGRRRGHGPGDTVCLCPMHHVHGTPEHPSIHSDRGLHGGLAAFRRVHGTDDEELAARVAAIIEQERAA